MSNNQAAVHYITMSFRERPEKLFFHGLDLFTLVYLVGLVCLFRPLESTGRDEATAACATDQRRG